MPAKILNTSVPEDDWDRFAHQIFEIYTKRPGTQHAKSAKVREMLLDVAADNFRAGERQAMLAGAGSPDWSKGLDPDSALALLSQMQKILIPAVPPKNTGHGAIELAQAAAAEVLRARNVHNAVEIDSAELMEFVDRGDQMFADPISVSVEEAKQAGADIKKLAIEIARLRKIAKGKP
jgi:hypothetical protein